MKDNAINLGRRRTAYGRPPRVSSPPMSFARMTALVVAAVLLPACLDVPPADSDTDTGIPPGATSGTGVDSLPPSADPTEDGDGGAAKFDLGGAPPPGAPTGTDSTDTGADSTDTGATDDSTTGVSDTGGTASSGTDGGSSSTG